ncbi:MAG: tRNA pseudouridine(38-40) synthase TruA [Prevotella sp.]|nr:tRNA pseudouridine(38-40) synthase TruA [Prevotella sp.]
MMRYFIWFSYDGTRYHGWQIQPNGITVQSELERCLSLLLRQKISVTGAGRTDTGVHARRMAAHFDIEQLPMREQDLTHKLNGLLPQDIGVYVIEQVSNDLHARFSAVSRTYHYYVHTQKTPFSRQYSLELHYQLNYQLMNEAGRILMEYDDFGSFCKAGSDVKTTICHVTHAQWHKLSDTSWYFRITANRFLRNMVRAVVGTLVEVGRGKMTLDEFRQVIEGGRRTQAGESMPAKALFLEDVVY